MKRIIDYIRNIKLDKVTIRDYILILLGAILQAGSLRIFLLPAKLASGGVSGLSQIINSYTGWPIGMMVIVGNIPLLILGWRFLGGRGQGECLSCRYERLWRVQRGVCPVPEHAVPGAHDRAI